MIISASRRTDIPAFYADWFFNRVKAQFVQSKNPYNQRIRQVSLAPADVTAFVFWTKNPAPMMPRLDSLKDYMYYFQFTITAYGPDIELHIPDKQALIIPAFQKLAEMLGPERMIWRFDPILMSDRYTPDYHVHTFGHIAGRLRGYTNKCIISFVDVDYRNTKKLRLPEQNTGAQVELTKRLLDVAHGCNITIEACAEDLNLPGIKHAKCIDGDLIAKLLGTSAPIQKDKYQRKLCGCAQSVDIGVYNTCANGCTYCYANYQAGVVAANMAAHNPGSPLLFG